MWGGSSETAIALHVQEWVQNTQHEMSAGRPRTLDLTRYLVKIAFKVGLGLTALIEFWYLKTQGMVSHNLL